MTTATQERTFRILSRDDRKIRVRVTTRSGPRATPKASVYLVSRFPAPAHGEGATGVEWHNVTNGLTHHVSLGHADARCDCRGHERWGACKHFALSKVLLERGELPREVAQ